MVSISPVHSRMREIPLKKIILLPPRLLVRLHEDRDQGVASVKTMGPPPSAANGVT